MTKQERKDILHTKIVATLGPASSSKKIVRALVVDCGVRVFRLNASHGDHATHTKRYNIVREVEKETSIPLAVLLDLQGPKIRIGTFKDTCINLKEGNKIKLTNKDVVGDDNQVSLPHPEVIDALEVGVELRLNDGLILMEVIEKGKDYVNCVVKTGGVLSDRKGVNIPGANLTLDALTSKDLKDLDYGLKLGVDWIALSFVQSPADMKMARELVKDKARLMAKIEKPKALNHIKEIVDLSDGIMLARGDLGVEIDPESVPIVQKHVVSLCREAGKPIVIATQMLESMNFNPNPTRAEVSDVSTALYDGADGVMLSAETASGRYPVESAQMMRRIIVATERDKNYWIIIQAITHSVTLSDSDAITRAAKEVADSQGCTALACFTTTGSTVIRASRMRAKTPLLGLTPLLKTSRALAMAWGVYSVKTKDVSSFEEMQAKATRIAKSEGLSLDGDKIVVTAGVPFGTPGTTNVLRITRVGDFEK